MGAAEKGFDFGGVEGVFERGGFVGELLREGGVFVGFLGELE